MKKTSRSTKKTTKKSVAVRKATTHVVNPHAIAYPDNSGFWGKDQPMVLLLAASIIILVVIGLYLAGWL